MPAEPTYGTGAKLTEVARQRLATERKAWRKGRTRSPLPRHPRHLCWSCCNYSVGRPALIYGRTVAGQEMRDHCTALQITLSASWRSQRPCPMVRTLDCKAMEFRASRSAVREVMRGAHATGETDWAVWRCSVPGKKGTDWEGGALSFVCYT